MLESLGLTTDGATDVGSDAAADLATANAAPAWGTGQSSTAGFADETPAVFTRGKGQTRPTGPSFDIKLLDQEVQDSVSSTAETEAALARDHDAVQGLGVMSANKSMNSKDGVAAGGQASAATTAIAAGKGRDAQGQEVDPAAQGICDSPGIPSALGSTHAATMINSHEDLSNAGKQPQLQQTAQSAAEKIQSSDNRNGITTGGVTVDIVVAQNDKTEVAADNTKQPLDAAQKVPASQASTGKPRGGFCKHLCCCHSSTRE